MPLTSGSCLRITSLSSTVASTHLLVLLHEPVMMKGGKEAGIFVRIYERETPDDFEGVVLIANGHPWINHSMSVPMGFTGVNYIEDVEKYPRATCHKQSCDDGLLNMLRRHVMNSPFVEGRVQTFARSVWGNEFDEPYEEPEDPYWS